MDVAAIPWDCVASFLGAPEVLFLRVVASFLNVANLYGEFGPLLFFLMQHEPADRINYTDIDYPYPDPYALPSLW